MHNSKCYAKCNVSQKDNSKQTSVHYMESVNTYLVVLVAVLVHMIPPFRHLREETKYLLQDSNKYNYIYKSLRGTKISKMVLFCYKDIC